ncbi:MAG: DUF3015 family protein [Nitrospirae bacterium]|nr:DUF3015 family protein [Nitrospirota bacterium]
MRIPGRHVWYLLPIVALLFGLSACTFKASTKAVTDVFTDFSSSTSGKSWVTPDGLVKENHRVTVFTTETFENLKQDMAQGQGEYLASLGSLLGVTRDREVEFSTFAQDRYLTLILSESTSPQEMLVALYHELSASPTLRDTVVGD